VKRLLVRSALAAAAVGGLLVYAVIVDLGMHAGRVHRGVAVAGFEIGGLTELEAFEALEDRQTLLEEQAVIFIANGFDCRATPEDLGWNPQPFNTAQAAMEVGRNGVWAGLRERFEGWFGGVKIGWAGGVDPAEVDEFLDYCERNATIVNARVDRPKLRFRIRRAIVTYPRGALDFNVPLLKE
jgi:hypothetical protein